MAGGEAGLEICGDTYQMVDWFCYLSDMLDMPLNRHDDLLVDWLLSYHSVSFCLRGI